MLKKIFFQSSLPRAGSTLLQNIFAQNPDFYSTPTSGVLDLFLSSKTTATNGIEFRAQNKDIMESAFKGFCRSGLFGYFEAITDKSYVIDKSRGWSIMYDFLNWFYPDPKIVVMIRDLRGIVSSLEKKFRQNPHVDSNMVSWNELRNTTTDKRLEFWLGNIPLGVSIDVLYDVIIQKISKKCLFVKFEEFCLDPKKEMEKIYEYFRLPYYPHDFDNVVQVTHEDDSLHGPIGDHKIRQKVQPLKEDYFDILGRHNCDRIYNQYNWFYKAFSYDK